MGELLMPYIDNSFKPYRRVKSVLFNIIIQRFCGFYPICVKSLLFNVII